MADDEPLSPQGGYIAPPSTPAFAGEDFFATPTYAEIINQASGPPESDSRPVHAPVPVYENATVPIQRWESEQHIDQPTRPHSATSYQHRFHDFDAARQALTAPDDAESLVKLSLEAEDDWQYVKEQQLHGFAAQLYDAIQAEPGEPPEGFTDFQRAYYYEHQSKVLGNIKEMILTKPDHAEARVMLLFEELISLHEKGFPEAALSRRTTTGGSFAVETNFICSARAEKVIEIAGVDKYVALDILNGTNITDVVRSPIRYLERKRQNSRVNAKKAENNRIVAQVQAVQPAAKTVKPTSNQTAAQQIADAAGNWSRLPAPRLLPATSTTMPRAGPAPRIKATLKRKVAGDDGQSAAKKAKN
ncbi:hypothetical protein CLAFUW4_12573 [Fulvia fulva]|uniref:Uncharacterized protein n=1 Tax=Passalora fulva TaxID=5499 RepID=A0A9Q8USD9_PASFU|nr:uncharacterized protein CLAFUR5_11598 [Fulvia fulva]KAK4617626.1 hypothetical protein CLAFUR4_12578 [Fulvia fulva]KAK4618730.1 hypothetical protein CLAFUR0_12589 [Fulvia fulva]UJO20681.1 hypothetical protein CLAFUR5_11598 [Fulvia fulva]WPV18570.1 hypothetical protein CLAFUW4_12573 [Fulvia fulva]WPV33056.1 hypothetical protein CLAFUW7_12580 [Fulvia fulva]